MKIKKMSLRIIVSVILISYYQPCCTQFLQVLPGPFLSVYSDSLKTPIFVSWVIHNTQLGASKKRQGYNFMVDRRTAKPWVNNQDFVNSGYVRGHLCPYKDKSFSREASRSTFLFSNIIPQNASLNNGAWKQAENVCRGLAIRYDSVRCCSGIKYPFTGSRFIGKHHLAVSDSLFKAVRVLNHCDSVIYWLFPNHHCADDEKAYRVDSITFSKFINLWLFQEVFATTIL